MGDFKNLAVSSENGVLVVTIDRAAKLNALNQSTLQEIKQVIESLYDDAEHSGAIITGDGEKAFAAGADISEFTQLTELNARKFAEEGQEIFQLIENCHLPIIAVVNGFALGGGCELAMACHMRVATEAAKFGQPEVSLGVVPGYGGTQRLTQLIGKGRAFQYIMTGDMIDANTAREWGLVNEIASDKAAALGLAKSILTKIGEKAPIAVELVVECVNAVYQAEVNGYQTEANAFAKCCGTEDFKEGAAAFVEKRKPTFKGS